MKLSKQVITLVEDDQPKALSEIELKKFWKDMQENIFKHSTELVKNDLGLFFGSTDIVFSDSSDNSDDSGNGIFSETQEKEIIKNPKKHLEELNLTSIAPKEVISIVLNDYTLERESTEEEDEQALEYFLKHIKGSTVYFYGETAVGEHELHYEGTVRINNFKYDASNDEFSLTDHELVTLKVNKK